MTSFAKISCSSAGLTPSISVLKSIEKFFKNFQIKLSKWQSIHCYFVYLKQDSPPTPSSRLHSLTGFAAFDSNTDVFAHVCTFTKRTMGTALILY